jgi:hypothetical protein
LAAAMTTATLTRERTLPRIAIRFDHDGDTYTVTFGRFPSGLPSELFLAGPCSFYVAMRMATVALQHGVPIETLRTAVIGNNGPMALALDRVIAFVENQKDDGR